MRGIIIEFEVIGRGGEVSRSSVSCSKGVLSMDGLAAHSAMPGKKTTLRGAMASSAMHLPAIAKLGPKHSVTKSAG